MSASPAPAPSTDSALGRAVVVSAFDAIGVAIGSDGECVEDVLRVALDHFACRIGRIDTTHAEAARDRGRRQTALLIGRYLDGGKA